MTAFGNVGVDDGRRNEDGRVRKYNAAFVAHEGEFLGPNGSPYPYAIKTLLPNYREFDDSRHFTGLRQLALEEERDVRTLLMPVSVGGLNIGCTLCEDAWDADYAVSPISELSKHSLDLLVNNAGVLGPMGWFSETDVDEWLRCIDINFVAVARLCHVASQGMRERQTGRILNISSVGAGVPAVPPSGVSAYFVSKTAVARLTEVIAAELNADGVAVFAVDPGGVKTAHDANTPARAASAAPSSRPTARKLA